MKSEPSGVLWYSKSIQYNGKKKKDNFCIPISVQGITNISRQLILDYTIWEFISGIKPPQKRKTKEGKMSYFHK
jgi:hypothetical protein